MGRECARRQDAGRGAGGRGPLRPLARCWARRRAARLGALYDFATLLAGERDPDRLLRALVAGLAARFAYRYASVFLVEDGCLRLRAQVGYATPITALALGEGITGRVARDGRPTLVRDGRRHPGYRFAEAQIGSQASVPLARAGRVLGVLNLEGAVGELGAADLRLLANLAAPAAALENAALVARLTAQATRDPLTGLLNRRGILAALDAALGGAGAAMPVSILLVDLNGFKGVNDRCGHAAGDRILADHGRATGGQRGRLGRRRAARWGRIPGRPAGCRCGGGRGGGGPAGGGARRLPRPGARPRRRPAAGARLQPGPGGGAARPRRPRDVRRQAAVRRRRPLPPRRRARRRSDRRVMAELGRWGVPLRGPAPSSTGGPPPGPDARRRGAGRAGRAAVAPDAPSVPHSLGDQTPVAAPSRRTEVTRHGCGGTGRRGGISRWR